jgi:hypothetical protein
MAFGDAELKRDDKGAGVVELQIRLAGFRGTLWDGAYGPGTELQVVCFQRDYIEQNYKYEYPGMHKAILHSFRAASFYLQRAGFPAPVINSGYRCWVNNGQNDRTSTNHMGKAIDIDFPLAPTEDKRADMIRCDKGRGVLVELANFQVGWMANNRKSLEPSAMAPTWIHMDVRNYERKYLADRFFVAPKANATSL